MSAVLKAFAELYRKSQAGRTGIAAGDFVVDYKQLLKAAGCEDGDARAEAELALRTAAGMSQSHLQLDVHPRDPFIIHKVRLRKDGGEAWLFARIQEPSPTQQRVEIAKPIATFAGAKLPEAWRERWLTWCLDVAEKARRGETILPFSRSDIAGNSELLSVLVRLLNWHGESLIRFASCVLCGHSKRLAELRGKIETCLKQITGEDLLLKDFGILDHPRQVLLHGPLRLGLPKGTLDLSLLHDPVAISETDIEAAHDLSCTAAHCLTVENEATFRELAKMQSQTLLVHTSYPGRGVVSLFTKLPANLPCFHFGDTDPAGFAILRALRIKTGRPFQALHMSFRDNVDSPILTPEETRQIQRLLAWKRIGFAAFAMHADFY